MCDCVWVGLCGCPRALFKIALHHFTPIPFTMISPTTQKKKATRENTGLKWTSQGLTMNVLKYIDSPRWWRLSYTAVQGICKAVIGAVPPHASTAPDLLACKLVVSLPHTHTHVLYSICTVVSFIPCWVWSNDFVRCQTWAQSQQHPEIIPNIRRSCFSLHTQDVTTTLSDPKCFCKQY